jgi:2-dehydropantoate 2-reductase
MRIAIIGTGGVGGYFGARLAAAGHDVTFVARGAHLEAIQRNGLTLKSVLGDEHIYPAQATDDTSTIDPVDIVLICVKSWATHQAAEMCQPLLGEGTGVISLQNGIEKEDILVDALGKQPVMGGLCSIVSYIESPGVIRHQSQLQNLIFGELDGNRTPRAEAFLEACQTAGIDATLSDDITRDIWMKFLFICAVSGMTSLTRQPLGPVTEKLDTRELMRHAMQEVWEVGRAQGVDLPDNAVEDRMNVAIGFAYDSTSSMQRDLEAGNRMEVGALNGTVARLGRELGIDTPVNRTIYACLQFSEQGQPH